MKTSISAALAGVLVLGALAAASPAGATANTDAPDIDFALPDTGTYNYESESLAVTVSGDFWLCATEDNAPGTSYVFKFAADSTTGDAGVQTIDLNSPYSLCDDLAVDLDGNVYVGLNETVFVYAADASGVATPIRQFTSAGLDIDGLAFDETVTTLYIVNGDNVWSFPREASGTVTPDRIIDGSDLDGGDLYVAATGDGTVFLADYDADAVRVFDVGNDGPVWDREFSLDPSYDARSFGGIVVNGEQLLATFQDGSGAGIYSFALDSVGTVSPINSWSGPNVVVSGNDALYDVSVAACVDHMVTFEGYNDRVLTWTGQPMVCPEPSPTPDPDPVLPSTGVDAGAVIAFAGVALALLVAGVGLARRRSRPLSR